VRWGGRAPHYVSGDNLFSSPAADSPRGVRDFLSGGIRDFPPAVFGTFPAMLGLLRRRRGALRLLVAAAGVLVAAAWRWAHAPRAWKPGELPVAFWAWRAETPP
jgi:hypothetical protein